MKQKNDSYKIPGYISILFLFIITISSCSRWSADEYAYEELSRKVGPDGKKIVYLKYSSDDSYYNSDSDTLITLNIPENAVDSFYIMNLHIFNDRYLREELQNELNIQTDSNFYYFIPYKKKYPNDDWIEFDDVNYFLTLDYNKPVTIEIFNISLPLDQIKLYRIKIPRWDEWGEENNIRTAFNNQGYPNGFLDLDLIYLINGKWTENSVWGHGDYSLENWEEIVDYDIDSQNNKVIFKTGSTDYIYTVAKEI